MATSSKSTTLTSGITQQQQLQMERLLQERQLKLKNYAANRKTAERRRDSNNDEDDKKKNIMTKTTYQQRHQSEHELSKNLQRAAFSATVYRNEKHIDFRSAVNSNDCGALSISNISEMHLDHKGSQNGSDKKTKTISTISKKHISDETENGIRVVHGKNRNTDFKEEQHRTSFTEGEIAPISPVAWHPIISTNSTIETVALDNREKMKRMFAARRRKAQLEMIAVASTTTTSKKNREHGGLYERYATTAEENKSSVFASDCGYLFDKKESSLGENRSYVEEKINMNGGSADNGADTFDNFIDIDNKKNTLQNSNGGSSSEKSSSYQEYSKLNLHKSFLHGTCSSFTPSTFASRKALEIYLANTADNKNHGIGKGTTDDTRVTVDSGDINGSDSGMNKSNHHEKKSESKEVKKISCEKYLPVVEELNRTIPYTHIPNVVNEVVASVEGLAIEDKGLESSSSLTNHELLHRESISSDSSRFIDKDHRKSVRFHLSPLEKERNMQSNPQCSPPRSKAKISFMKVDADADAGAMDTLMKRQGDNSSCATDNDEDIQFFLFMAGLKREVAGEHTELWSGFQSLLGHPQSSHVPLYQSFAESDGISASSINSKDDSTKKKKKIRMDPQTQKSLTAIHKRLMLNEKVKNGFMTISSQLVNDKQTKKDRIEQSSFISGEDYFVTSQAEPIVESSYTTVSKSAETHMTENSEISLEDQRHDENVLTKDSKQRLAWITSYKKKKSHNLGTYINTHPNKSEMNDSTSHSALPSSKQSYSMRKNGAPFSSNSCNDIIANSGNSKSKIPSWLEALTKKQKSQRWRHTSSLSISSNSEIDKDSEGIEVELSPRKKTKSTSLSTLEVVSPWSHVHLRNTPRKAVSQGETVKSAFDNTEQCDTASIPPHAESLPSPLSPGEIIDLENLPRHVFITQEESSIFPLEGCSESIAGQHPDKVVIIGTSSIITASCFFENGRKANVIWSCYRSEICSLTLNVEATGVTLALTNGRPSFRLDFPSADVCLDFAQRCCRRTGKKEEKQNNVQLQSVASLKEQKNDANVKLTKEEESLLEKYRQFSHKDRPKLQLTCLSPKGQQVAIEVALSPTLLSEKNVDDGLTEEGKDMLTRRLTDETKSAALDAFLNHSSANSMQEADVKGVILPSEEERIASKYRTMLKIGIPPDAVRHKMTSDAVQSNIIDSVIDHFTPNASFEEEEVVVSKYKKMLKMKVPKEAVKHKMISEGMSTKIIDAVFALSIEAKVDGTQLSCEDEVIASKYRKMLKMAIPLEAVKQKMAQDSVHLNIVSAIVSEASARSDTEKNVNLSPMNKTVVSAAPILSQTEEKEASKYRMMLKVCIPIDAVRHEMKKEGVSDKIIEAVLGKESVQSTRRIDEACKETRKTIALHWTTSKLPPDLLKQSIFAKSDLKKRKLTTINPEESDIKKLEELFQKRSNINTAKIKGGGLEDVGSDMAKLVDLTRANNIAISLKKFNDFTFRSLAETINDLDPDCKINDERIHFIPNLLPTAKEIQAIKKYNGDDDKLVTAELFFQQLVVIKRIEDKVQVIKTMAVFEDHIHEIRKEFKILQEVCGQVLNSEKLIQVLDMVLSIGNLMNEGTLHGGVEAFKFESLPKLSQTKSSDGKITVLDYIVETFIKKGEREALYLTTEFPCIQESMRLSICDLVNELHSLRKECQLCNTELEKMKKDQVAAKKGIQSVSKKSSAVSGIVDPREALFAAIKAQGNKADSDTSEIQESNDLRQVLPAVIKCKRQTETVDGHVPSSKSSIEFSRGVQRLQNFIIHSEEIFSLVELDQDAAVRACKGLALYCGEEGGEKAAAFLLQILCEFAYSLESAIKKYDARVEAEKRKAVKVAKEKKIENIPRSSSPKKLLKLSSLQPHVSANSNGRKRNTYLIGKGNPDGNIRQKMFDEIRNIENKVRQKSSVNDFKQDRDSTKQALLSAIKNGKKPSELKESRVLLVNRMLSDAPADVKRDFLRGVTYEDTNDPLLKKIYEKESK